MFSGNFGLRIKINDMNSDFVRKPDWETMCNYDTTMETRKWKNEIPYIKFPSDWEVKIIPPFAGATVRFLIRKDNATVSVYLDCYDHLGCVGQPYWEVYPHDKDTYRCFMNDTDMLLSAISRSIDEQNTEQ